MPGAPILVIWTPREPTAGFTIPLLIKLFVGISVAAYMVIPFVVLGITIVLKPILGRLGVSIVKLPPVAALLAPTVNV